MFDKGEMGLLQKVNRSEKSICPNCFHYGLCMGEYNQPCFECNGFLNASAVTFQKWIPVSERLPDDNERVIAYRPIEADASAYKYCVMWGWSVRSSLRHMGISHWMPLPNPPKED